MLRLWPSPEPVFIKSAGLVLREWTSDDTGALVALYDTPEMDLRTPVASPFDGRAADDYVSGAHRARAERGALQLAITEDGGQPHGEVLAFPTVHDGEVELAYAVHPAHRGRALASRAVGCLLPVAAGAGAIRALLLIAPDNVASQGVARIAGFTPTNSPLIERRRKGRVDHLARWERVLSYRPDHRGPA